MKKLSIENQDMYNLILKIGNMQDMFDFGVIVGKLEILKEQKLSVSK